jgi:hypothetical protein
MHPTFVVLISLTLDFTRKEGRLLVDNHSWLNFDIDSISIVFIYLSGQNFAV